MLGPRGPQDPKLMVKFVGVDPLSVHTRRLLAIGSRNERVKVFTADLAGRFYEEAFEPSNMFVHRPT